jgi:uncharacterized protein (TIGR00251 family)
VVKVTSSAEGLLLGVRVSPGAKRTRVLSEYGGRLKVQIGAPPREGRANECLLEAVADWLQVPGAQVTLRSGHKSRDKVVAVRGLDATTMEERLQKLLDGAGRDENGEGDGP